MVDVPARLHVLLARDASVGVVIRRGPSKRVATFLWDRTSDAFTLGQWLHGRIYERRSDLSPDGRHLIYFAMNGHWKGSAKGSWSAVSRAPYLKALLIYPKGDCWNGGGLWLDDHRYWLNDGAGRSIFDDDGHELICDDKHVPEGCCGSECLGVYFPRLLRDGWTLRGEYGDLTTFAKPLAHGWSLVKFAHAGPATEIGKGCYWDAHALEHNASGREVRYDDWEWADVDRGRLVWASGGRLFAGDISADGLSAPRELFDFNPLRFEAVAAPY